MYDSKERETPEKKVTRHPTELSVFVTEPPLHFFDNPVPYITTDRHMAWMFNTKIEAKKWARFYGSCYIDCYWTDSEGY